MKPPENQEGGSWRRPRPTQGCSASKEEERKVKELLFELTKFIREEI
jgi:hypothetical protein